MIGEVGTVGGLFGATGQLALGDELVKGRGLSQWHTPPRLVHRVVHALVGASWLFGKHVVEPSAGGGAFVDALLEVIGEFGRVTAVELDLAWAAHLRARYAYDPRVTIVEGDYLTTRIQCDIVLGNPPYEDGLDCAFMAHALDCAGRFAFVLQSRVLHGREREDRVWSRACVRDQGVCVGRPSFGGGSAKGEFSAFRVSLMQEQEATDYRATGVRPLRGEQRWADDWSGT